MPELPEVETTRRGVLPLLGNRRVTRVEVHDVRLRQPVTRGLAQTLVGQRLVDVTRRAKYLLFEFERGTLLVHLGMSGSLRVVPASAPLLPHDHVEIAFGEQRVLRLRDPRRFGLVLWTEAAPAQHVLLKHLGPEPLEDGFDADYLFDRSRGRALAVKNFVMDAKVVVGVGNIYASEALFRAGIRPTTSARRLSRPRLARLVGAVRTVLSEAIAKGGSTLRDYVDPTGQPGYFQLAYFVYGRESEPCRVCGAAIRMRRLGGRASYYCPSCQT